MSRHYETVVSAIEAVRRETAANGKPLSKPITQDEVLNAITDMHEFDLGPIPTVSDMKSTGGSFKMRKY